MNHYIRRVLIKGLFEQGNDYKIDLSGGCNCIYGANGTGKTTIINLIVNSLSGDVESLAPVSFESITIKLAKTGQKRPSNFFTLTRELSEESRLGVVELKYLIEGMKTHTFTIRRGDRSDRIEEKYGELIKFLKERLLSKVKLTHVPLLRMHDSELFGVRDERDDFLQTALRHRRVSQSQISEIMDPSVRVLNSLQNQFMSEANEVRDLITQKLEGLKSKLIGKVMIDSDLVSQTSKAFKKVNSAYRSNFKGVDVDVDIDGYVRKLDEAGIDVPEGKIKEHFGLWRRLNEGVKNNYENIQRVNADKASTQKQKNDAWEKFNSSYLSLFAMTHFHDRFLSVVNDVELMQDEKDELTKSFKNYEIEVNKYLNGRKTFSLSSDGRFFIRAGRRPIRLTELSSGEKHILSILGKAALSSDEGAVFVADEPELSLHLDWQRMILPSIMKLSPKSQIIVATHSPSIFAKGATEIDLEECI